VTNGCFAPAIPCQGDGIGPLDQNYDGFRCKHTCECNNQGFYGVCLPGGTCKVFGRRAACNQASIHREILVRNRFFSQECPSIGEKEKSICRGGAFDKVCQGKGLSVQRWANCKCVGELCRAGRILCGENCHPDRPCRCIDTQKDPSHCGRCHQACPKGGVCQSGECVCPKDKALCETPCQKASCAKECVFLSKSSSHCGKCGKVCPQGGICAQGICQEVPLQAGAYLRGTPYPVMDWAFYKKLGIPRNREDVHMVLLTRPFFMGRQEVTRGWFKQIMGYDPSDWKCFGDPQKCPVHHVNLYQAMEFCNRLSKQRGLEPCYLCDKHAGTPNVYCSTMPQFRKKAIYKCKGYRLPTDAEWEYAVRAGTGGVFHELTPKKLPITVGENYLELLGPIAWYSMNAKDKFHPVATKKPNPWGLYDMLGNVTEWVWETSSRFFEKGLVDPYGEHFDWEQSYRGGHIFLPPLFTRNGFRGTEHPSLKDAVNPEYVSYYGFRIARTSPLANESCSNIKLSACGSSGCKDTRGDSEHCGVCHRKCTNFHICRQGKCDLPEVEIPTYDKSGKPIVWSMGWENPKPGDYCTWKDAPMRKVKFSYRFVMGRFEVRQRDFDRLMGFNPSRFRTCLDCPVESVTWFQALAYANALSKKKGFEECYECFGDPKEKDTFYCTLRKRLTANQSQDYYKCSGYRLPTEAEWEFAALSAGTRKSVCAGGDWGRRNREEACCEGERRTKAVGSRRPNEVGLFNTIGNVSEWVWDGYAPYEYDPKNPKKVYTNPISRVLPIKSCKSCSPKWDANNSRCAPCFRGIRGTSYHAHVGMTRYDHFDESRRVKRHLTNLYYESGGHLTPPSTIGFRLVRTIQGKK